MNASSRMSPPICRFATRCCASGKCRCNGSWPRARHVGLGANQRCRRGRATRRHCPNAGADAWPARNKVSNLWGMTYILMGLRYEQALVNQLLEGVVAMEESVTYQAILARGALEEARKTLLLF